jgi:hypothetical protein
MISVKGGNVNNVDNNYNIVKDTNIKDLFTDKKYIFEQILNSNDISFYKEQILFYYKNILVDINYTDNHNKHIDFYIDLIKDQLKKNLNNKNTFFHFNNLCNEFNIKNDLSVSLHRLYNKLIEINKINISTKNKSFISSNIIFEKKELTLTLKHSNYKNEVLEIYDNFVCGIFVKIKNNKLFIFQPFFNKYYKNKWKNIKFQLHDKTIVDDYKDYYKDKEQFYRKEKVISDINGWWNNGFIIDNEYYSKFVNKKRQILYWSNYGFETLIGILKQTCKNYVLHDCEFIINKREYPIEYNKIPILNFYSKNGNDCIPTTNDISQIFKEHIQFNKINWEDKIDCAIFRGSLSGIGNNKDTNQRIKLGEYGLENIELLNVKFTSINIRDRIININENSNVLLHDKLNSKNEKIISYLNHDYIKKFNINKENYVGIEKQNNYKYIIYCQGTVSYTHLRAHET